MSGYHYSPSLLYAVRLALFLGHRRNSLASSTSSNCYFCCQKVGNTNQTSEHCHMTRLAVSAAVMLVASHFVCLGKGGGWDRTLLAQNNLLHGER